MSWLQPDAEQTRISGPESFGALLDLDVAEDAFYQNMWQFNWFTNFSQIFQYQI